MRLSNTRSSFAENGFFKLKNQDWLDKQRVAGRIAATALKKLERYVTGKTFHSTLVLSRVIEEYILKEGGTPTFKGYKGFPEAVCISVNKELVHGIPKDQVLDDGDIVSFDLGVTYEGAIADTAITCIFGTPKSDYHVKMVHATEDSLMKGIQAIEVGKKLGCIGNAIYKCAKGHGFNVINHYGGHGLDWNVPHASPFVENKSDPEKGFRIQPGLAIAIEPMLVPNSTTTKVLDDGWTVVTNDIGAHFEHSIFVHPDRVEIITDRSNICLSDS
jgi:methionyl aminopeptidase